MAALIAYGIGACGMFILATILGEQTHDPEDGRLREMAANGVIAFVWPAVVLALCVALVVAVVKRAS